MFLADGPAACFADGPVGLNRPTLWLLASLAPERWRACSLAVFDDGRSVVVMADDAPPIEPDRQHLVPTEIVTLRGNYSGGAADMRQAGTIGLPVKTLVSASMTLPPFLRMVEM